MRTNHSHLGSESSEAVGEIRARLGLVREWTRQVTCNHSSLVRASSVARQVAGDSRPAAYPAASVWALGLLSRGRLGCESNWNEVTLNQTGTLTQRIGVRDKDSRLVKRAWIVPQAFSLTCCTDATQRGCRSHKLHCTLTVSTKFPFEPSSSTVTGRGYQAQLPFCPIPLSRPPFVLENSTSIRGSNIRFTQ